MEVRITSSGKRHTARSLEQLGKINNYESRDLKRGGIVSIDDKSATALNAVGLVDLIKKQTPTKKKLEVKDNE